MAKMSQIDNFPEFLAIKWERKVLQTQFWYQKKALAENDLFRYLFQNPHKSQDVPVFSAHFSFDDQIT